MIVCNLPVLTIVTISGRLFCNGDRTRHDLPPRPSAPHPEVDVAADAHESRDLVAVRHVEPALQSSVKRCNVIVTPLGSLLQFSRHSRTNLCSTTHQNGLCKKTVLTFCLSFFLSLSLQPSMTSVYIFNLCTQVHLCNFHIKLILLS